MPRKESCLDGIDIVEKAICVSKDGGMELLHFGKIKKRQLLPGKRFRRNGLNEVCRDIIIDSTGKLIN